MQERRFGRRRTSSSGRRWRIFDPPNRSISTYKHNGRRRLRWQDVATINDPFSSSVSGLRGLVDLYRHHYTVFARYCAEGRCTAKQLKTIEALYIDGMSLH